MNASDSIHAHLRHAILAGELAPGDAVPSERRLSAELGVNRQAVREALKRLQQSGLVRISQGGPTRVLDWRTTAGLDVIVDLWRQADAPIGPELAEAIAEFRACIGVDIVRLCALRGSAEIRLTAAALAERLAGCSECDDERRDTNRSMWTALTEGSGNFTYRLAMNTLHSGLAGRPAAEELFTSGGEDAPHLRRLARALASGDPDAAAAAASDVLSRPLEQLFVLAPRAQPRASADAAPASSRSVASA
jgi:DNA-binding FadR family transcriptional regulator